MVIVFSQDECRRVLHWAKCLNAEGHAELDDLLLAEQIAIASHLPLDDELARDLEVAKNPPPVEMKKPIRLIPIFSIENAKGREGNQPPTVDELAAAISKQYRGESWFQSVGKAGDNELVLYLVKKPIKFEEFKKHLTTIAAPIKVRFEVVGRIRPAGDSSPPEWVPPQTWETPPDHGRFGQSGRGDSF